MSKQIPPSASRARGLQVHQSRDTAVGGSPGHCLDVTGWYWPGLGAWVAVGRDSWVSGSVGHFGIASVFSL